MSSRQVPSGALIVRSLQLTLVTAIATASLWGLLGGCREQSTVPVDRNLAPETFVTSAPGDSQTSFYRVPLHWMGTDHDGAVIAYEVAVTESLPEVEEIEWTWTERTDSLFTFSVEETREVLGHRFYVRAIDNEGKVDPTPAFVFFGARNSVPPVVEFYRAIAFGPDGEQVDLNSINASSPTDTIPTGWGVSFAWSGSDGDVGIDEEGRVVQVGSVARYSHRLLPIESEFLGGTIADTVAFYDAEFFNRIPKGSIYVFEVRATDDGGLSGSGTVLRSFIWNRDPVSLIDRCLPPEEDAARPCFVSRDSVFYSGDTLALPTSTEPLPDVKFSATAYDPDPLNGDPTVAAMEWRSVAGAIINPWTEYLPGSTARLENLVTADYIAMVRSIDQLERVEGTPDSVIFYVNFSPRFVTADGGFQQAPMPDLEFTATQLRDEGLECNFLADNPDAYFTERIRYGVRLATPFSREVRHHHRMSLLTGSVYHVTVWPDTTWTAGNYTLYVLAEDNKQSGGEARGTRSRERAVPFRVVAR